jgi:hypothetical protein
MNEGGAINHAISSINPRFLNFYFLKEYNHPFYEEKTDFLDLGLKSALKLINFSKYQLADFKDNFLKGKTKTNFIARKAEEMHQVIDQIDNLEARIRRENFPFIQKLLNNKLAEAGRKKLVKGSHDLTSLAETCAVHVLETLAEFDLRKSVSDYFLFVEDKVDEKIDELTEQILPDSISWKEFKLECLDTHNYEARAKYLMPYLSELSFNELRVMNGLYGLNGEKKSIEKLSGEIGKPISSIKRFATLGLTKIALKIDLNGFVEEYYKGFSLTDIRRSNNVLRVNIKARPKRKFIKSGYSYYLKNYKGWTNNELRKNDKSVYNMIMREGKLHLLPAANAHRSFGGNPYAYYLTNHNGITRGKLARIDESLYNSLRRYNQLHLVPTKKSVTNLPTQP